MTYDPPAYWQQRGLNYRVPDTRPQLAQAATWLREVAPASILEVGAGWGRCYLYLQDEGLATPDTYRMVDFVDAMRQTCQKETGLLPDVWDGHTLPYQAGAFDLVLLFSVLLHVPPADAPGFLSECARVAGQWLLVGTMIHGGRRPLRSHCFQHDNPALFAGAGLSTVHFHDFGNYGLWLLRKAHDA